MRHVINIFHQTQPNVCSCMHMLHLYIDTYLEVINNYAAVEYTVLQLIITSCARSIDHLTLHL